MGKKNKNKPEDKEKKAAASKAKQEEEAASAMKDDEQEEDEEAVSIQDAAEKVDKALKRRSSIEDVQKAGIMKTEEDMNKRAEVVDKVAGMLESRPSQEEIHEKNEHIINPTGASRRLSGALASTAKSLEKNITADKIDRHLNSRPEPTDLEQKNVLKSTSVAPTLQHVQEKLQRQMNTDELSHRLESRPDKDELKKQGIELNEAVAPSLQATQGRLQRQLHADRVHQHLEKRPSLTELTTQGVIDQSSAQLAPRLSAAAKKLERSLVQSQVSHLLEGRPDKGDLVTHNILEDTDNVLAPALQGTKHQLERQLTADQLARHLRKRPSLQELEDKGIVDEGELGDDTPALVSKKCMLSQRSRYTLALKATTRIAADELISAEEKARLKDLILSDDEKVVAAIECYELDQDIEELLDTLYRVAKIATAK